MISRYHEFTSGYFDVVIADECHRSIYGAWQAALTHFDAFHIGLTATPAAYIERNTYQFYHCKDGQPDFALPIQAAFKEGLLAPYKFAKGITCLIAEGTEIDGTKYDPAAFERDWTNEDTNRKMMEEFDRLAWENYEELAPKQKTGPGKAIVFAITKHHAARLARYLNELHPEAGGRYAEVITSDIPDADAAIRRFKKDTYPMVAVSVDMLTTGFDCREVLHIVMCRSIFSPDPLPADSRTRHAALRPHRQEAVRHLRLLPQPRVFQRQRDGHLHRFWRRPCCSARRSGSHREPGELVELGLNDEWLEAVTYVEVGPEGERVDKKEYVTEWEKALEGRPRRRSAGEKGEGRGSAHSRARAGTRSQAQSTAITTSTKTTSAARIAGPAATSLISSKPRSAPRSSRPARKRRLKISRRWLITKNFSPQQASYLSLLKNRGVARGKVELGDLFQPPLSILDAANLGIELFGESGLRTVIDDLNQSVFPARSA